MNGQTDKVSYTADVQTNIIYKSHEFIYKKNLFKHGRQLYGPIQYYIPDAHWYRESSPKVLAVCLKKLTRKS